MRAVSHPNYAKRGQGTEGLTPGYGVLIFTIPKQKFYYRRREMPIYEYRCKDCETVFETFVSSSTDADKVVCKKCQSKNVVKQISTFAGRVAGSTSGPPAGALSGCSSKSGFS